MPQDVCGCITHYAVRSMQYAIRSTQYDEHAMQCVICMVRDYMGMPVWDLSGIWISGV